MTEYENQAVRAEIKSLRLKFMLLSAFATVMAALTLVGGLDLVRSRANERTLSRMVYETARMVNTNTCKHHENK